VINELKDFRYDVYIKFLKLLKQRYRIVPFCEVSKEDDSFLILRHDVDASLEAALKMARVENNLGVRSTYFVLFSHKLYNLLEKDDLNTLREISKLGHEIGLHYDVEVYESYRRDLKETLKNEIKLLERLLNRKVFSIACHNVSIMSNEDPFKDITGYINAYDPELCENYVSDSCRAWYLKDLSRLLTFNYKKAQLLIHPFLWTEDVCKRDAVLERFFRDIEKKNKDYKLKWLEVWHKNPKVKDYDKLVENISEFKNQKS
jgi:hypothetical protein